MFPATTYSPPMYAQELSSNKKIHFDSCGQKLDLLKNIKKSLDYRKYTGIILILLLQKHNLKSQENRPLEQSAGVSLSIVRHKMKGVHLYEPLPSTNSTSASANQSITQLPVFFQYFVTDYISNTGVVPQILTTGSLAMNQICVSLIGKIPVTYPPSIFYGVWEFKSRFLYVRDRVHGYLRGYGNTIQEAMMNTSINYSNQLLLLDLFLPILVFESQKPQYWLQSWLLASPVTVHCTLAESLSPFPFSWVDLVHDPVQASSY